MPHPRVISMRQANLRDPNQVYIGRAGHGSDGFFGNPFRLTEESPRAREICLMKYESWFENRIAVDPEFRARVLELKGKTLVCFCAPRLCHGDVIARWLDQQP